MMFQESHFCHKCRSRKENLARAIEHEADGNSTAAFECYQKAVDISPSIAYELIQALKRENVCYIVAPYEADAQLTFLAISKRVEAVITEDSDLIPFGCTRIIFKMDKFGQGVQFRAEMLQRNKDICFMGFSKQMVLEMCIMSGCDYLQSLPGMGLKKAHALIKKFKSYDKAIKHLKYSNVTIPPMYEESFKKAVLTFQYQRVYDPNIEDIVHLTDLPDRMDDDLDFLGPLMPQHVAKGVAEGDLDPFTKLSFQGRTVDTSEGPQRTYKINGFKPEGEKKRLQLPRQRNLLTNYLKVGLDDTQKLITGSKGQCTSVLQSTPLILPCRSKTMLKDQECQKPIDEVGSKIRTGCQKVVVRSSYFQDNVTAQNCCEQVEGMVCGPADILIDKYKYATPLAMDDNPTDKGELGTLSIKDSAAADKGQEQLIESKDDSSLDKCGTTANPGAFAELSCHSTLPRHKGASSTTIKTIENGKLVTRSSYFQRTKVTANDCNTEKEMAIPITAPDDATDLKISIDMAMPSLDKFAYIAKTDTAPDKLPAAPHLKRKVSFDDIVSVCDSYAFNNAKWKKAGTDVPETGDAALADDYQLTEPNPEDPKFGCNISHLDKYKDISGKLFHTLTSSSRFYSSGSRASGLRAPLKDVRNTSTNRSATVVPDISKFAYVPGKSRTGWKRG
uniref:XPG-I domain-containing protein n=1 Tax=Kalanchoe fedtschenkoi TaxID=63787 RepID=A0A7N0U2B7_KALFE